MRAFHATWWHKSGFWTSGTFLAAMENVVRHSIAETGGTHITVSPA